MGSDRFTYPNEHFPGSELDIDLLSAVARIEQIDREGAETCGGLILDRLISCDAPRLRRHISKAAQQWEADAYGRRGVHR